MAQVRKKEAAPPLEVSALLATAETETGLHDFGDPGFRGPLHTLVQSLREEPSLLLEGRAAAAEVICELLATRLRFVADRTRYPIAQERIVRPLIVMGEARSGTTLLHTLLAEDPANRAPRYWEVQRPSPPPGIALPGDPRIAQASQDMEEVLAAIPGALVFHPYWDLLGLALMECERLLMIDFRGMYPSAYWRVPVSKSWVLSTDYRAHYAFHKQMLQQLQWGAPPRRWALKGVRHHYAIAELREAYPDAMLLWTHRDPVQAITSGLAWSATISEGLSGKADRQALAARLLDSARASAARDVASPYIDDDAVFHVRFPELINDPVGMVRKIYDHFALPYSEEFDKRLRTWVAGPASRSDRYGTFERSIEPFGVSAAELDRQFAPYRERFGLA